LLVASQRRPRDRQDGIEARIAPLCDIRTCEYAA